MRLTCVQILVVKDTGAAWRMGGAGKAGSWELGGSIKGVHSVHSHVVQTEGVGVSANSFRGYTPLHTSLPPHGPWLLPTAAESTLPLSPFPGSLFPCRGPMVLVEFQSAILLSYLECPRSPLSCALHFACKKPFPILTPPHPAVFSETRRVTARAPDTLVRKDGAVWWVMQVTRLRVQLQPSARARDQMTGQLCEGLSRRAKVSCDTRLDCLSQLIAFEPDSGQTFSKPRLVVQQLLFQVTPGNKERNVSYPTPGGSPVLLQKQ